MPPDYNRVEQFMPSSRLGQGSSSFPFPRDGSTNYRTEELEFNGKFHKSDSHSFYQSNDELIGITKQTHTRSRHNDNSNQALVAIHQRQQTLETPVPPPHGSKNWKKSTLSNLTSSRTPNGPRRSPELGDKTEKAHRIEDAEASRRKMNRLSRNNSPVDRRGVVGSPEWQRQVRIVDQPDRQVRDSQELIRRERTGSRSRSRTPRRDYRHFRVGSPVLRSRSLSRRLRVFRSPDNSTSRRRNSRSPVLSRGRKRSPVEYNRTVVERTVLMRRRSHSLSRPVSSQKRFQESHPSVPVIDASSVAVLFTRNYVAESAQVPFRQTAPQVNNARYFVPPTFSHPVTAAIQPLMDCNVYFNPRHHFEMAVQQQQRIIPPADLNPNLPPSGAVPQVVPPIQPAPSSTSNSSDPVSAKDQRIRTARDGLLKKQGDLIRQLLVLQVQQADLEMKQKSAAVDEYENLASNIIENAKLEKEMTASAQSLQKILQKHTNHLKEDLTELKKSRTSSHRYSYYDPHRHWCELCDVYKEKLADYLNHLHSKEHEERLQSTGVPSTPWHKKRQLLDGNKTDAGVKSRIPFNGLQCLQPVKAWYCELCDVWMGDTQYAQLHMNSNEHNEQHLNRRMERPDSNYNQTIKKQSALRRNIEKAKFEEMARNKVKRIRMEAEMKEATKKREEELKEKWENFVRNEESHSVVELEEPASEKNVSFEGSAASPNVAVKSIKFNIRTPFVASKLGSVQSVASEQMESADYVDPISESFAAEQIVPGIQVDIINLPPALEKASDVAEKYNQGRVVVPELTVVNDCQNPYSTFVQNSAENSGTSKSSQFTRIDGSSQQEFNSIPDAEEKRRDVSENVDDGEMKFESESELMEDCVIVVVNPKSAIQPEIIDLEPPNSNRTDIEMPSENIENQTALSEVD